jgi:DNA primase
VATPSARASALARSAEAEARVGVSAILAGCLNHPAAALLVEDRLERLTVRCQDLGQMRDALLSALGDSLHEPPTPESLQAALQGRLGFDPLPRLMTPGQVRANRHLRAGADPEAALRAIDEELTRHSARTGRDDETREAMSEIAGSADEALTARLRSATEAEHAANIRPMADAVASEDAEHHQFMSFFEDVVAQQASRKPRRH